jgi:D-cysteine desulfhydrase
MQSHRDSIDPLVLVRDRLNISGRLPWLSLGAWPTPVRPLMGLSKMLGVDIWMKEDDQANAQLGGNKVRKLELILGEAKERGAGSILTVGGMGSHQVTALGAHASRIGASVHAIVYPVAITPWVLANLALWKDFNVRVVMIPSPNEVERGMDIAAREVIEPTYLVQSGGSSALGNLGYVGAALELASQVDRHDLPRPTRLVIASGTGGSVAGLLLGLALTSLGSSQLIAVRCGSENIGAEVEIRRQVRAMIKLVERLGGRIPTLRYPKLVVMETGAEYGIQTEAALSAIDVARATESLTLESTYTARAFAKLQELRVDKEDHILFWHTAPRLSPRNVEACDVPPALTPWLPKI